MVRVNVTRVTGEVGFSPAEQLSTTRQGAQALVAQGGAATRANVTRVTIEVLYKVPPKLSATRQGAQALVAQGGAATRVNTSRVTAEVAYRVVKKLSTTRQGAQALVAQGGAAGRIDITRVTAEALARRNTAPVVPLALASGLDFFFHNWASAIVMDSGYLTDITISAKTGAEDRRGLVFKPYRTLQVLWNVEGKTRADRLLVQLRRLTKENLQIPLYQDQTEVTTSSAAAQPVLSIDTTKARFFPGARVAIIHPSFDRTYPTLVEVYQINTMTSTEMNLTTNIVTAVPTGALVFPLIDCHKVLEPELIQLTHQVFQVALSVAEVEGASQLPAWKSDNPDGCPVFEGASVMCLLPNWVQGFRQGLSRQGEQYKRGRGTVVYTAADRARYTAEYAIVGDRATAIETIKFWDSRRGRLRSFWAPDQENLWTLQQVNGVFLEFDKLGQYADFVDEFDKVSVILKDGTTHSRDVVTVQDLPSQWRMTVDVAFPVIAVGDIERVVRTRRVRFQEDGMQERWSSTGVFSTVFRVIETLDEKDVIF